MGRLKNKWKAELLIEFDVSNIVGKTCHELLKKCLRPLVNETN